MALLPPKTWENWETTANLAADWVYSRRYCLTLLTGFLEAGMVYRSKLFDLETGKVSDVWRLNWDAYDEGLNLMEEKVHEQKEKCNKAKGV